MINKLRIRWVSILPLTLVSPPLAFPSVSSFSGFNTQGCLATSFCTDALNGTILGVTYEVAFTCCSTDKCNPTVVSGAPSAYISTTVALTAALVASVCGSGIFWGENVLPVNSKLQKHRCLYKPVWLVFCFYCLFWHPFDLGPVWIDSNFPPFS